MEVEIRKQYETETGKKWCIIPYTHGENAYASWEYQLWLEKKVSQVEKPVILQGELLPCPFCGGEASIGTTRISDKRTRELNNRDNGFFVNCKICGANNNFLHLGYATEEIAKEHWNKRAGREPQSK